MKSGLYVFGLVALLPLVMLQACSDGKSSAPPGPPPALTLSTVVSGISNPVDLQFPDDGTGRMFIVQQGGLIRIATNGSLAVTPFLDITGKVNFSGEMGLLGLAFHPQFPQNHLFYVHYDRLSGSQVQSVIAEYSVSTSDSNQADPNSERILLTVNQPFENHKGGQIVFGPDGFLYIGLGDGGNEGDPLGNGQNLQTLLGKMLRIDVDHQSSGMQYAIPSDNPFVSGGGLPEIWAYGFRNPWRFSFDRSEGRLFVGDVGQDKYEEIDIATSGGNFGWNTMEGMHCFNPASGCNMSGLTLPIAEYDHSEGEAVMGGYVYRGSAISGLAGAYVLGDFIVGTIWELTESNGSWTRTKVIDSGRNISSFGQDVAGELYVADYNGSVLRVVAQSQIPTSGNTGQKWGTHLFSICGGLPVAVCTRPVTVRNDRGNGIDGCRDRCSVGVGGERYGISHVQQRAAAKNVEAADKALRQECEEVVSVRGNRGRSGGEGCLIGQQARGRDVDHVSAVVRSRRVPQRECERLVDAEPISIHFKEIVRVAVEDHRVAGWN
jgi:glucose/arabinose dehydrogenase